MNRVAMLLRVALCRAVLLCLLGSAPMSAEDHVTDRTESPHHNMATLAAQRGGFMILQLSPHCLRALVAATIACSQVGPAGLAGCGVLLHRSQTACP